MMKKCFLCFIVLFVFASPLVALSDESGQPVIVTGFGDTVEIALEKALSEAVVAVTGAILAERSTLIDDDLKDQLIRYSRGTVKTYDVIEEITTETGFSVTIRAFVDYRALSEKTRDFFKGFYADVSSKETQKGESLESIADLFAEQIRSYNYNDFIVTQIKAVTKDEKTKKLTLSFALDFNKELFFGEFLEGLSSNFNAMLADPSFKELLSKESGPEVVVFSLLNDDGSSESFSLPVNIANRIVSAFGFSPKGPVFGAAFRGAWLHLSLMNAQGDEIERIPVSVPLTNLAVFLMKRKGDSVSETMMDRLFESSFHVNLVRSPYEVIFAPCFGQARGNGDARVFFNVDQSIYFELPESLLSEVAKVGASLVFDKR